MRAAISLSPNSPEPYNGRGIYYLATSDDDNAFADFNHAIELGAPGIAPTWSRMTTTTSSCSVRKPKYGLHH